MFLNWLRPSCVVSITTVATRHPNSKFLDCLRKLKRIRQGNKEVTKHTMGPVIAFVLTLQIVPIETLFV